MHTPSFNSAYGRLGACLLFLYCVASAWSISSELELNIGPFAALTFPAGAQHKVARHLRSDIDLHTIVNKQLATGLAGRRSNMTGLIQVSLKPVSAGVAG